MQEKKIVHTYNPHALQECSQCNGGAIMLHDGFCQWCVTLNKAIKFISQSADSLKSSLWVYTEKDLEFLHIAHDEAEKRGYKTTAKYLASRIRKLTV